MFFRDKRRSDLNFFQFLKITPHMHSFEKCFEQQRRKTMIQTERRDDIDRKKIFFLNQESNFESVSFVIIHLSVFVMQFLSNILQNEIYQRGGEHQFLRISLSYKSTNFQSETICKSCLGRTHAQIFFFLRQIIRQTNRLGRRAT